MKRAAKLCTAITLATVLVGCGPQSAPTPTPAPAPNSPAVPPARAQFVPRESNDTMADKGMQNYGGAQAPAADHQVPTDLRNRPRGNTTRSARSMAYELESINAVEGAAVLVKGRDAYVGVREADGLQLGAAERNLIVTKMRRMDPTLQQIFITTDGKAVQVLSEYTNALEQARPLQAHEQRFQAIARDAWSKAQK
ncbi:MAG: YhcN/YlaJ family sporulation lipoprotein [Tumebacillaceae bacterium]